MLCLKSNYALPENFKVFALLLPHSCRSYGPRTFSRMPWNFAQKEYQVSEKSQTSKLFKNRIRWNFLTLIFLFSNHEKLSPAFFEVSFAKNSGRRLQLEKCPRTINIEYYVWRLRPFWNSTFNYQCKEFSEVLHILCYDCSVFHRLERFVEVCACAWDYFCFVYSAEECIKDREVVPTDLVNKVKITFQSHYCFWDLVAAFHRVGLLEKKFRSGVFHVTVRYFLIKITSFCLYAKCVEPNRHTIS